MLAPRRAKNSKTSLIIDKTAKLEINGSAQQIRLCAERAGLPPILVVQAGPGLPLLHEVPKFQKRLRLETDFLVGYWEQRGCGSASPQDARSVSLQQQVKDLCAVLRWYKNETQQNVILFGISLGGTIALLAEEHERDIVKTVIAISPDANTAESDAAAYSFLRQKSLTPENPGLSRKLQKLGEPPYTDPAPFQKRAQLLADLGGIERDKKFTGVLIETLFGMIRTYGLIGAVNALRNMNLIQRGMLPELASLNLFATPPRLAVPVHYIFGERDPLTPATIVTELPAAVTAPKKTVALAADAGHMVHFDQPELVRSIVMSARNDA